MKPKRAYRGRSRTGSGWGSSAIAGWRILRKSLDARSHDDLHFTYSAEVQLAEESGRGSSPDPSADVQPYMPERFDWPEPGTRPTAASPGDRRLGAGRPDRRLSAGGGGIPAADPRAGPGRQGPGRRRAAVRRERAARPREQLPVRRGRGGHVQRRQADLPRHRARRPSRAGDPGRLPRQASIVYEHRPHLGSNRLPLVVRTLRRKLESLGRRGPILLPGRGPRHRRRPAPRAARRPRATSPRTWRSWRSATAPATPTTCCCAAACRSEAKPFQLGVRIEQPQAAIDRARYGHNAGHPALGAADYVASVRTGAARPLHVLHVRRRLRDAQRQRPGILLHQRDEREPPRLAVRQQRPGRHDRAGGDRAATIPWRASIISSGSNGWPTMRGGGTYAAPLQWARNFLAERPSRGTIPTSYRRGGKTVDLRLVPPRPGGRGPDARAPDDGPAVRRAFLRDATLTGPESRGSSPVRIPRDPTTRESPGVAGLYPCGEGAGYAGGIVSAAVDGLRTARVIVATYANVL